MADHFAEQILDTVVTLLTGLTTTGSNVARDVVDDQEATDFIIVSMGAEGIVEMTEVGFGHLKVDQEVFLLIGTVNANVEQQLNLIKKEIIQALKTDYTLGLSFVEQIVESGWTRPEYPVEDEDLAGICEGTFIVRYLRDYDDPSTLT